jgi:hypothetical protein
MISCGAVFGYQYEIDNYALTLSSISILFFYIAISEMGEVSTTMGKREGFGGEPTEKRPFGRTRRRWEGNK